MVHLLLIGAGFSRNWGGWLATEAFEHLLGSPEVVKDESLRQLLWRHQGSGGFEAALGELQAEFACEPNSVRQPLMAFQNAVTRMFHDMNAAFMAATDWQFGQQCRERQISTFLARFDAIFTLNQDVLLEHHYSNSDTASTDKKGRHGAELPGMRRIPPEHSLYANSWSHSIWTPLPEADFKTNDRRRPIYKLHGSSNWSREDKQPMLIMGGAKALEIGKEPILNWYAKVFEEKLTVDNTRLMVIGYGFRDNHINSAIANGIERGLKLFIIAPEGAELALMLNKSNAFDHSSTSTLSDEMIKQSLIGASRRSLRETFGHDDAEFTKVMRFFQ